MSNPTELKSWMDLYGVAVRAGAITPQMQDEEYIRKKLGLPEMSEGAKSDWEKGNGIRKPITLAPTGSEGRPAPGQSAQPAEDQEEDDEV